MSKVFNSSSFSEFKKYFGEFSLEDFIKYNEYCKNIFRQEGITYGVYSKTESKESVFPFDLVPRVIHNKQWKKIDDGLRQRNLAINLFLKDLYNEKKILKDRVVPADLVFSCQNYNTKMLDFIPIGDVYNHISGTDMIEEEGRFYVLEDNIRNPSGVSYVLGNRLAMKKTLSNLFKEMSIVSVDDYPNQLLKIMQSVAPEGADLPNCVILTPGIYNSAYYEHSFLAKKMGIRLVEGRDLFVDNNFVYMKTIYGKIKVDVIYRRIDDDFLDPLEFDPTSMLGVPGIFSVYRQGNVNIINAPGAGVADDKAIYSYMPDVIKYYLDEESILPNVPTYICSVEKDLKYVLDNLDNLVVKPVAGSGGVGIFFGEKATKQEKEEMKNLLKKDSRNFIAQPVVNLSTEETFIEETNNFEPRHVDLRTFFLNGKKINHCLPGGLTRVALNKGSLVVNSSQGGGSKDTWIIK